MTCQERGCLDGRKVRRYYRPAPRPATAILCADCVRRLNGLYDLWQEWQPDRRTDPDRAYKGREARRVWQPRWRQSGIAKDLSGQAA